MTMVSSGLAWLQQQLAANAGQEVVYRAGRETIAIPDAILGNSEYESEDAAGAIVRTVVVDWLIPPNRLTSDDARLEPKPGHQIDHTVDSVTRRYEVQNLGDEGCWRYSGPSRDRLRIHVREIPCV